MHAWLIDWLGFSMGAAGEMCVCVCVCVCVCERERERQRERGRKGEKGMLYLCM